MTNLPETLFHEAQKQSIVFKNSFFYQKAPPPSSENIFSGKDRADWVDPSPVSIPELQKNQPDSI